MATARGSGFGVGAGELIGFDTVSAVGAAGAGPAPGADGTAAFAFGGGGVSRMVSAVASCSARLVRGNTAHSP